MQKNSVNCYKAIEALTCIMINFAYRSVCSIVMKIKLELNNFLKLILIKVTFICRLGTCSSLECGKNFIGRTEPRVPTKLDTRGQSGSRM